VLRPTVPATSWPWLPLLTGHTVAKALAAFGYDARLKWPNDVLLDGLKVAGILVERIETETGPAAVVGVGQPGGLGRPRGGPDRCGEFRCGSCEHAVRPSSGR
jgi:hypothetical protein